MDKLTGTNKYDYHIPKTCMEKRHIDIIEYFMATYGMSKSRTIRHIFENGLQFMAMFGDGIDSGDNS